MASRLDEGGREGQRKGKKNLGRGKGWMRGEERVVGGKKERMDVRRNSRRDRDRKLRMDVGAEGGKSPQ